MGVYVSIYVYKNKKEYLSLIRVVMCRHCGAIVVPFCDQFHVIIDKNGQPNTAVGLIVEVDGATAYLLRRGTNVHVRMSDRPLQ